MTKSPYEIPPIGIVESPLVDRHSAPKRGDEGAPDAWLVFDPSVSEGIRDPIGLHRVRIVSIDGSRVQVRHLEALNGTPIVDVKPLLGPVGERALKRRQVERQPHVAETCRVVTLSRLKTLVVAIDRTSAASPRSS